MLIKYATYYIIAYSICACYAEKREENIIRCLYQAESTVVERFIDKTSKKVDSKGPCGLNVEDLE